MLQQIFLSQHDLGSALRLTDLSCTQLRGLAPPRYISSIARILMSARFSFLSDVSDKEEEAEEKKSPAEKQPTQTKTGKKRKALTEPAAKTTKKKNTGQVLPPPARKSLPVYLTLRLVLPLNHTVLRAFLET